MFEVKLDHIDQLLYPTALMAVAIMALIGLALFRWLTNPAEADAVLHRAEERIAHDEAKPGDG